MNSFLYRDERRKWHHPGENPPPLKHEAIHYELKREALSRLKASVSDNVSLGPMIQDCPDRLMDLPISSVYWKAGVVLFIERIGPAVINTAALDRIHIPEGGIKLKKRIEWPLERQRIIWA